MPVGRPASAIAAGYLGLFSLLPFVGHHLRSSSACVALRDIEAEPEPPRPGPRVVRPDHGASRRHCSTSCRFMLGLIGMSYDAAHGRP